MDYHIFVIAVVFSFKILLCRREFIKAENHVITTKISQIIPCKDETTETNNEHFNWHWTNKTYTISKPNLCWMNGQVILRQCNTTIGQWMPKTENINCHVWQNEIGKCPKELIEVKWRNRYVCLKISNEPQVYQENYCYGSDYVLQGRDLNDPNIRRILLQRNITEFWLPINFYNNKSFNPLVIRLPGKQWNELYYYNEYAIFNEMSNAHCFVASFGNEENDKSVIKAVSCHEKYHAVCVFKDYLVTTSGCPRRFGALTYKPTECFGILPYYYNSFNDQFHKLTIEEYYEKQTTIWIIFNKRRVRIRRYLQLADYAEPSKQIPKNLTWVLDRSGIPQIMPNEGYVRKYPRLLSLNVTRKRENTQMKLYVKENTLILIVYNIYYLWSNEDYYRTGIYCYTNNQYGETTKIRLRKIWTSDLRDRMIYKFKLKSYDPNLYWCEGHSIFNFDLITSNTIIASKINFSSRRYNFVMQLNYNFKNTTSSSYIYNKKKQSNNIRNDFTALWKKCQNVDCQNFKIHNLRIMDIIELTSINIKYTCHITVSATNFPSHNITEISKRRDKYWRDYNNLEADIGKYLYGIIVKLIKLWQPKEVDSVRSTEYCFDIDNLWRTVQIGQVSAPTTFCLQRNGLPPVRKCVGNFVQGAYWADSLQSEIDKACITTIDSNLITHKLYSIETKQSMNNSEHDLIYIRKLLKLNLLNLIPADLFYLSNILKNTLNNLLKERDDESNDVDAARLRVLANVLQIQNELLKAEERLFATIAFLNSTNVLLSVFETIIDEIFVEISATEWSWFHQLNEVQHNNDHDNIDVDDAINITAYHDVGVAVYAASNFLTFIIDPQVENITGIAIYLDDCHNITDGLLFGSFSNKCFRYITFDQNIKELINDNNIMIAAYVPETVWQRLDEIAVMANRTDILQRNPKVVIKIYANDKLFQENLQSVRKLGGKVLSISIPGHDEYLPGILPIIFNIPQYNISNAYDISDNVSIENVIKYDHHQCSYWNYKKWSTDGVTLMAQSNFNNSMVVCGATHLTPFAYLLGTQYRESTEFLIHQKALDIITILGCCLSLFGISGLFLTACIFRSWRNKANSIVLLQLSTATALQMILFCFVNTKSNIENLILNGIYTNCIIIGALLHYFVLVQFIWMIIIAYLQFKRYVQVFGSTRPKRFFIKSSLLGWTLPLIPVISCLLIDSSSYVPLQNINDIEYDDDNDNLICYPTGKSLYYGVIIPISIIVLINLIIFIIIVYNLTRKPIGSTRHLYEKSLILSQIRLYILLFFLLGFTWIFGFMSATNAGLIFSYLFCLTATLQGLVLFIYFIIMDPVTRRMWWKYLSVLCGIRGSNYMTDTSSSLKNTSQSFSG